MKPKPHLCEALGLLVVVVRVPNRYHPRAERTYQVLEDAPAEERPEHLLRRRRFVAAVT